MSYADALRVSDIAFAGCGSRKRPGDLVRLGSNHGPVFEIVAVEGPTAWIREPVTFRGEALVPLHRLRLAERD